MNGHANGEASSGNANGVGSDGHTNGAGSNSVNGAGSNGDGNVNGGTANGNSNGQGLVPFRGEWIRPYLFSTDERTGLRSLLDEVRASEAQDDPYENWSLGWLSRELNVILTNGQITMSQMLYEIDGPDSARHGYGPIYHYPENDQLPYDEPWHAQAIPRTRPARRRV